MRAISEILVETLESNLEDNVSTITPSGETEESSNIFIFPRVGISAIKSSTKELIFSTSIGLTIIVSPKLVDNLNKMVPNIRSSIQNLQSLRIVEDSSLSPDGVIIETPSKRLDSRISAQIGELAQKMLTGGSNGMG